MNRFLEEVFDTVRVLDLALILSAYLLILFVYSLPEGVQNLLVLDFSDPTVFALWSSAFVHQGFTHLSENLQAYTLSVFLVYLWFALAGCKRLFRYTFAGFLTVLPVSISLINLSVLNLGTIAGFSGIAAAFYGLIPFALFLYIHEQISEAVEPGYATAVFIAGLAVASASISGLVVGGFVLLFSGLLTVYYLRMIGLDDCRGVIRFLQRSSIEWFFVLFSVLLFLASPVMLFPEEIVRNGSLVNIFAHYLGMAFGFFGPVLHWQYRMKE